MSRLGESLAVEEIAGRFGVSRETVRRDLARLDDAGLLRRVHGGAVVPRPGNEPPFQERQKLNMEAKRRIGLTAAGLFQPGDSVMIDTGSTTEQFAIALAAKTDITVITNSNRIATSISAGAGQNRIFVLGGAFRGDSGQILGSLCIEQLAHFNADHVVLGVGALGADGRVMDYDVDEASLARAMIARARTVTILADRSKFDRQALITVCRFEAVTRLVTDLAPSGELAEMLTSSRVAVIVASAED
ncbi:DeoR/GlpR transcriptional regulator [Acidisoma cellulosilytica]|uniref:DeoR/GlpR transcriptional regulator n=2 Tax=Acidisoma cellulosilyticum TaxID=2802395 RepID=A0A964E4V1_9PROT|nr:DeoR/GlpR transcriptional regulator [Acidisoma cellulosilyticum]